MSDENEQHENDSQADASNADETVDFEPLTATYERLRHSTDSAALSEFARRPLPDRSDQAAFSRATALLEAVAGNAHTPVEDRVFLAETCRSRTFWSSFPPTSLLKYAKPLRETPMTRTGWWPTDQG